MEILKAIAQIKSSNPFERSSAAKRLGELNGPAAALLPALDDRNQYVRAAAAGALAQADLIGLETEAVGAASRKLLMIPSMLSAWQQCGPWDCFASQTAREQIAACLQDSDPENRASSNYNAWAPWARGRRFSSGTLPRFATTCLCAGAAAAGPGCS